MVPTRRVAVELLRLMAEARRQGEAFDDVWERNVRRVLRLVSPSQARDWRAALVATVDAWRLAYERQPIPGAEALEALAGEA